MVGEEPRHLGGRLEVALGIGLGRIAQRVHGGAQPDGGQHVGEAAAVGVVVADVAGGEQPGAGRRRQPGQGIEPAPVIAPEGAGGRQEERQGEPVAQRRGIPAQPGGAGGIGPGGRDRPPAPSPRRRRAGRRG